MIHFTKASKQYDHRIILNIDDFALPQGLYWLTGDNGTGKTTFLKMIAGLTSFTGTIKIDGISLTDNHTAYKQKVSYTEAEPLYPPYLSGKDLIHFFKKTRRASEQDVKYYLSTFNIESFIDQPVSNYSSGMVKRLALVLVFLGNPDVILLDEPLVTLDYTSQHIVLKAIANAIDQNQTVIFTSHQAPENSLLPPYKNLCIQDHKICFR